MNASAPPVLLVAGGSRGIGAATATLAAARGFDVAVNYLRDSAAAEVVVAAIEAQGRAAIAVPGDMACERDVERAFATVDRKLGTLTHLVYSCGITGPNSRLEAVETETLRKVLDLNVLGALLCTRAAIARISVKHGGRGGAIVLLSSAAATIGSAGEYVWYAASKGAIDSMTLGLARELAGDGIRVNAVAPGIIATQIHPPGRIDRLAPTAPMARAGTAAEVAEAIVFLLSEASSYVTGTVLRVAGGR
jgi:NAD(P)-dependent dehydrogenase (short-subunit alcohol dehydrogenase family)